MRGFVDANNNRILDRIEIWDSTGVNLADSAQVELLAFLHDTLGPRISEVLVSDSTTIRVTFDRGIDTSLTITPEPVHDQDEGLDASFRSSLRAPVPRTTPRSRRPSGFAPTRPCTPTRSVASTRARVARHGRRRGSAAPPGGATRFGGARAAGKAKPPQSDQGRGDSGRHTTRTRQVLSDRDERRPRPAGKAHEGDRVFSGPKPPVLGQCQALEGRLRPREDRGGQGKAPPPGTVAPPAPSTTPAPATPPPTPPPAPADTSPRASPPSRSRSR